MQQRLEARKKPLTLGVPLPHAPGERDDEALRREVMILNDRPYLLELGRAELQLLLWACDQAAKPGRSNYKALVAIEERLQTIQTERWSSRPENSPPAETDQ